MLFRRLRQAPVLSLTVVLTIAVGCGALVATFAVVDATLLRDPPFPEARELVMLYTTRSRAPEPVQRMRWSYPRARLLRDSARSFAGVANYTPNELTLTGTTETESVRGEFVSWSYFSTLGVRPLFGRTFVAAEDEAAGAHPVVLVGHAFWQRRFGGDPGVLGRSVDLNGRRFTVLGVLPPAFRGLSDKAQVWIPATMAPVLTYPEYLVSDQNFISVVGRLKPGISIDAANAELQSLGARVHDIIPLEQADPLGRRSAVAVELNKARVHGDVRRGVLLLVGAVALLYLLACVNVTNLLLGRALARRHEVAVRSAMGGRNRDLFLLYFVEGWVLVAAGGTLGTAAALLLSARIVVPADVWGPSNFYGSLASFSTPGLSWRVVVFGVGATLLSAVAVAWAPAASTLRVRLTEGLGQGLRGAARAGTTLRRPSARGAILALETALAVVLLVAGGLMLDTFRRMRGASLGVDTERVLTFSIAPPEARVPTERAAAYVRQMLEAITAVPGVVSATVDGGAPVSGTARSTLQVVGRETPAGVDAPPVLRHYVGPDHFRTLGVPLVRGRVFTDQDKAGSERVAVISETAARRFWPNEDPLDARVWFNGGSSFNHPDSSARIVGIVGDVVYEPLDVGPNRASFYTPYAQFTYGWRIYFVRTSAEPLAMVGAIGDAVRGVDGDVPLRDVQSLQSLIGSSWSRQRFNAWLFGAFAALALALAVSGVYAVVSYAVGQRTREMGIRLALGASPRGLLWFVVRESLAVPMMGVALGVAAALAAGGVLRASLYGVASTDPTVLTGVVVLLGLATVAASWAPAGRAARVAPSESLRAD